ncbi:T9SS type A sorting domain-containing protein [Hanstruepera marina]|uniref:T9SS type A sorting domain-containing protein n=1 Tax=Hanstruepera marina TaxID=2873265 RepID=UPI001CA66BC2|nr:T9SS type A sorting domain-containing protein [Hanstruepera marina]
MLHHKLLVLPILLVSVLGFSQNPILCPHLSDTFKISESSNVPTITENDDGTIMLISPQQYITDIFNNYSIYGFERSFPTADSEPLSQYYTIFFENKDLIVDLYHNVPSEIFEFNYDDETVPTITTIDQNIIDNLNGKTFYLKSRCFTGSGGLTCENTEEETPEDMIILLEFNYDSSTELLNISSPEITPCGNSFNIDYTGKTHNQISIWNSVPEIINESYETPYPDCHAFESSLYRILGVTCDANLYEFMNYSYNNNELTLSKETGLEAIEYLKFEDYSLSTPSNNLDNIQLITPSNSEQIYFKNMKDSSYQFEIFDVSGKSFINSTIYGKDKISINQLPKGLYFIRLNNSKSKKVFKFIKK